MQGFYWALCGAGILFAGAVFTGWWRYALRPWCISTRKMTVRRLGLKVTNCLDIDRVDDILESFAGGFNRMLTSPSEMGWQKYCQGQSAFLRPFAEEGAAMGYTPRRMFHYDAADFEARIVKPRPGFRYLYYVGLGFWSGMRNHNAAHVHQIVEGLDPLHSYLCFDGYGFKVAFFDYPKDSKSLRKLDAFEGYAQNAAYQGVGRALHFLFMGNLDMVIQHTAELGEHALDAAAGLGLAASFINPDRLEREFELGRRLPADWQPHFHLGLCFGLKARSINDLDDFEQNLFRLPLPTQDAIRASIRECDRIELLIRADGQPDGYRRWREHVTNWMTANIEFPMQRQLATETIRQQDNEAARTKGTDLTTTASPLVKGGLRGVESERAIPAKK
jgi:hypothetical protein